MSQIFWCFGDIELALSPFAVTPRGPTYDSALFVRACVFIITLEGNVQPPLFVLKLFLMLCLVERPKENGINTSMLSHTHTASVIYRSGAQCRWNKI
jgi:hypothetical protein